MTKSKPDEYFAQIDLENDCVVVMGAESRVCLHIPEAAVEMLRDGAGVPPHVMLTLTVAYIMDRYGSDPEVKTFVDHVKAAVVSGIMMDILDKADDDRGSLH